FREKLSLSNISAEWLTPDEIKEIEPDIFQQNFGGALFPEDGQLHPIHLANSLHKALKHMDCKVNPWLPALSLIIEQDRVIGARTPDGDFYADYTVLSAGTWSSSLVSPLGINMP